MKSWNNRRFAHPGRWNTYTGYSIACFVAWTIAWAIFLATKPKEILGNIRLFFIGWLMGWTSSSIARLVYPPPQK